MKQAVVAGYLDVEYLDDDLDLVAGYPDDDLDLVAGYLDWTWT